MGSMDSKTSSELLEERKSSALDTLAVNLWHFGGGETTQGFTSIGVSIPKDHAWISKELISQFPGRINDLGEHEYGVLWDGSYDHELSEDGPEFVFIGDIKDLELLAEISQSTSDWMDAVIESQQINS